jgi:hypothetical protein
LVSFNSQHVKSVDEVVREQVIKADPDEAYRALVEHRRKAAEVSSETIPLVGQKRRARIPEAKGPFLDAILAVLRERRRFWPLSDRAGRRRAARPPWVTLTRGRGRPAVTPR